MTLKEVRILRLDSYSPHKHGRCPSLEGYLPVLFLEHVLTFELMHRYSLQRFVWSLWLDPHGKSKNLQSRGLHLRARTVAPLRIVLADFLSPFFLRPAPRLEYR